MSAHSSRFYILIAIKHRSAEPHDADRITRVPTDYESKEHVDGEPQSQAGQGSLVAHTVRGFADLRRFGQNIPQQEILIQFRVDWASTFAIDQERK
ncbi:hypothetical protein [Herbaspirillum sp. NPDC101397]|uniref:hypothetical protein n=1 Tax=Herbaspirillum sp. NPDC101397 TaxID=3364006 RepID=UPI00383BB120